MGPAPPRPVGRAADAGSNNRVPGEARLCLQRREGQCLSDAGSRFLESEAALAPPETGCICFP